MWNDVFICWVYMASHHVFSWPWPHPFHPGWQVIKMGQGFHPATFFLWCPFVMFENVHKHWYILVKKKKPMKFLAISWYIKMGISTMNLPKWNWSCFFHVFFAPSNRDSELTGAPPHGMTSGSFWDDLPGLVNSQFANLKMAIDIVSFPMKNGDFL
jgi:hypothetical protein